MGSLERHSLFLRLYTLKSRLYGNNEDKVLSVSKFVAEYQRYVHIKAFLARRYILIAWGQVNMTLIPESGKANCTDSKGYLTSLLSFMQKTMQKMVIRNIWGQSMGHVPYIYTNLPTNQGSPHKLECTT